MDAIRTYAENVSSFGGSPFWLFVILRLNLAFSAIHIFEEWRGSEVPLWRAFGAIEGVYVPDWLGFPLFTVLLLIILWIVGVGGIAGQSVFGPVAPGEGVFLLGVIVGALVSDSIFSHWILYLTRFRPNPGLRSTSLYVLEAVLILVAFWKGRSVYPEIALSGIVLGALFFLAVWGLIVALRLCFAPWRRTPWLNWQPIPSWART